MDAWEAENHPRGRGSAQVTDHFPLCTAFTCLSQPQGLPRFSNVSPNEGAPRPFPSPVCGIRKTIRLGEDLQLFLPPECWYPPRSGAGNQTEPRRGGATDRQDGLHSFPVETRVETRSGPAQSETGINARLRSMSGTLSNNMLHMFEYHYSLNQWGNT